MPRKRSKKKTDFNQYLPLLLIGVLVVAFVFLGADPSGKLYAAGEKPPTLPDHSCDGPNQRMELNMQGIPCCVDYSDESKLTGTKVWCEGEDSASTGASVPGQKALDDFDEDGAIAKLDCDDTDARLNLDDLDKDGFTTCDGDCDDTDSSLTPIDEDGDGWSICDGDCDDKLIEAGCAPASNSPSQSTILTCNSSGAQESKSLCLGSTINGVPRCAWTEYHNGAEVYQYLDWNVDNDLDGYGSENIQTVCSGEIPPSGYTTTNIDCDDTDQDSWLFTLTTKADIPTSRDRAVSASVDGKIYVIGGKSNNNDISNKVEVYDPSTDTWTTKAGIPTPRYGATSAVVDGKIYVFGGMVKNPRWDIQNPPDYAIKKVEVYDPSTDTWTTKASLPESRASLSSAVVDGKIYLFGGITSVPYGGGTYSDGTSYSSYYESESDKVEVYDPSTDTWTTKKSMNSSSKFLTTNAVNGKIYVTSGTALVQRGHWENIQVYDPSTDTWTAKASIPSAGQRDSATSVVLDGKIYLIGGNFGGDVRGMIEYDPETNILNSVPYGGFSKMYGFYNNAGSEEAALYHPSSAVVDGEIYLIGKFGSPVQNQETIFTPKVQEFSRCP